MWTALAILALAVIVAAGYALARFILADIPPPPSDDAELPAIPIDGMTAERRKRLADLQKLHDDHNRRTHARSMQSRGF